MRPVAAAGVAGLEACLGGKTARWPKNVGDASSTIDYAGVIDLIDRYAEAITGYQDRIVTGEFGNYEKTLAELARLAPTGVCWNDAAILQKCGRRPDSGEAGAEARRTGRDRLYDRTDPVAGAGIARAGRPTRGESVV